MMVLVVGLLFCNSSGNFWFLWCCFALVWFAWNLLFVCLLCLVCVCDCGDCSFLI